MGTVQLAYARDRAGRRVSVLDLDPRRRRERAPFTCPGCGEALVPHLGRVRARHFSHLQGSRCPLTSPETALHQNAKERLLTLCEEAFAGRRRVLLGARCPACRRPAPLDLATLGDGASAEAPLGPLRADVLVTRRGTPALALEVRVAHALEADKEEALARLSVAALEIDARRPWEREEDGATVIACGRGSGLARCAACEVLSRSEAARGEGDEAAAIAELEAYRARGLLASPPGRPRVETAVISGTERQKALGSFACPDCGGQALEVLPRLVRHACPGQAARPVAWRGYDGTLVVLGWWRR